MTQADGEEWGGARQSDGSVILRLPQDVGGSVPFVSWLRTLSLGEFATLYGYLWNSTTLQMERWQLWPGVRGWPGQPEMLRALETSEILWMFKSRQIAATTAAALYMAKIGLTEPKALSLVYNKDEPTAQATLKEKVKPHLDVLRMIRAPDGGTLPWPRWDIGVKAIDFEGDGRIEAKPSSSSGTISRVPRFQLWDEVREYEDEKAAEMYSSMLPVLHGNAQLAVISTNKPGSWYSEMSLAALNDWRATTGILKGSGEGGPPAVLKGMPRVTFMFLPYDTVPARREPGWYEAERNTLRDDVKMRREYPREPEDAFASKEGLVLPSFKERNTTAPPHLERGIVWWPEDKLYLVYDHGRTETHPALCWFVHYRPSLDHIHVFDHVFKRAAELPETAADIMTTLNHWWAKGAPAVEEAFGDVTGKEFSRRSMQTVNIAQCLEEETGLSWVPANKHDKEGSLELARSRVFHGLFTIDPVRCADSVKQLSNHKFKEGSDDPSDKEDEALDLLRYASIKLVGEEGLAPRTYLDILKAKIEAGLRREAPATGIDVETLDVAAGIEVETIGYNGGVRWDV